MWRLSDTVLAGKEILRNFVLMSIGSIICSIAVNGILIPHYFFGGGFTGLSLVIHYLIPSIPVAVIYFLLNIPLFTLGWMYVGRRFFLYSILGMIIFSFSLEIVQVSIPVNDNILCALLAGIITGLGGGIILRSMGSAGGLDILSVIFLKRFSVRLGSSTLAFNAFILSAGAILISLEQALYTLIFMYVSSRMLNLVVTGLSQRKAVLIISKHWQEICNEIMEKIHRGVTIIEGRGGYTGHGTEIIYTVVSLRELPRLKQLAQGFDPHVFIVVLDTIEVMGNRIGNQPHW